MLKEFGVTTKIAWHLDEFGHSMATNDMFQQMGYEDIFVSRINDMEKEQRIENHAMEFYWSPVYEGE